MRLAITFIMAAMTFVAVYADTFKYSFNNTPVSQALISISKDHPDVNISFIYKELDNYRTSAIINTDDIYDALRTTIGQNPISIVKKNGNYYIEAFQRGKFRYTGRAVTTNNEPVPSATIMLLAPKDSTVITYGTTDDTGRFAIPCDKEKVILKLSCLGYMTTFRNCENFSVGTITMQPLPILLNTLKVESDNAHLYSDRSVYIPTQRQKNAAQTAGDLIESMAIPQLRTTADGVKTNTGQPVNYYIDFIPATQAELTGMRIDDVKRVEYYDFPSDPRFQGDPHVINFIMQKYEYGGYMKGIYYENFVASRQVNGYAKMQYKNMTYDWAGGAFNYKNGDNYENLEEVYRLPQTDGSIKEFERNSTVTDADRRQETYWTSLKALYRSKDITMSNMISADFDHSPKDMTSGTVTYKPEDYTSSEYTFNKSSRVNSFTYSGSWYFNLPHNNSITFNPYYSYGHTNLHSAYDETGIGSYVNGARDDSHQASGTLALSHSFGKAGTLKAMCQGRFLQNHTWYSGTSNISDIARTYRLGPGVNYSYRDEKFYGLIGLGLHWDRSTYGSITENSTAPWANLSLQYAFNAKNSVSADVSYSKSIPSSSYRSASVIQANPLMRYTGNPALVPYNSLHIEGSYTLIPSNKWNISAFGYAWIVDNRYVYDYEASAEGILRTIKQPMGSYAQWQYGIQGSIVLFNRNLRISPSVYMDQAHNGVPYNWNKSKLQASVSAYYYLNKVYFGAGYSSPLGYPDGCMVGTWMEPKSSYIFQFGWSNKNWNLRFFTRNPFNSSGYMTKGTMKSTYYDETRYFYSTSYTRFFQISATYTFAFGKKVKDGDEAYQPSRAASGILK